MPLRSVPFSPRSKGFQIFGSGRERDRGEQKEPQNDHSRPCMVGADQPLPETGPFDVRYLMPGKSMDAFLLGRLDNAYQLIDPARLFQVEADVVLSGYCWLIPCCRVRSA